MILRGVGGPRGVLKVRVDAEADDLLAGEGEEGALLVVKVDAGGAGLEE